MPFESGLSLRTIKSENLLAVTQNYNEYYKQAIIRKIGKNYIISDGFSPARSLDKSWCLDHQLPLPTIHYNRQGV